jgi:glycosyltransferase involved in cell wall biosynthesis
MSHPIHYFLGLFREIHNNEILEERIYFCSDFGIKEGLDKTFNRVVKWYDKDILTGINYRFLKNFSFSPNFGSFFSLINPSIIWNIKTAHHDAIFMHSWNFFSNWLTFFAARFFKIPIFLRVESPYNQEILKSRFNIFIKKILLGKVLFPFISAFLYIGEQNKKFYQFYGIPDSKLFFVPYSVDNIFFQKQAETLRSKKNEKKIKIGINPSSIVVLFVGKLIEKKRPLDLLSAFHNTQLDNAVLVFVGDGPLRGDIEKYVADNNIKNVTLLGIRYPSEISEFYILADIFVLPSGSGETWGLVVNEAMNFGLPIIVSDMVGCGVDLVHHGENGFVFPLGNIKYLSRYLSDLINNSSKRNQFGIRSREIISSYDHAHDISGIVRAFENSVASKS